MELNHHPPDEHCIIFILSHIVVGMLLDVPLSQSMLSREVVEHADNGISPLPSVAGFINEVVDLPWDGFTMYPKDCTLARSEEVYGAWLERV